MQNSRSDYEDKYTEMNLLGRGNYGAAYVVQNNINGKLFVAKKMNLDGMPEADVQAARGEIEILEKFSDTKMYPFIVKYNECFLFDTTLVIVMEYCEFGDLATFLKNAKKKGELLEEKVIMAWFVMLVMGIQSLHSKNILHRDLKSANIFLTSNKFIKIGDFGISKVLDSTSAKTFIGTPYYLSPEVCSNKKYDLRSDLWSLGCILYELCTLNYPFQANNILSLAMKITTEEVQPIPSTYSKELNSIVMGLLTKDQAKRKTLEYILKTPYMEKFIQENGSNIEKICASIPLKRNTAISKVESSRIGALEATNKSASTAEDTMKTIMSNHEQTSKRDTLQFTGTVGADSLSLSQTGIRDPKAEAKMRKQEKIRKEQQALKQAVREGVDERKFARSKKQEEFGGSGSDFGHKTATQTLMKKYQDSNKQVAEQKHRVKNGLADNQSIDLAELFQLTNKIKDNGITQNLSSLDLSQSMEQKVFKGHQNYKVYTEPVEQDIEEEDLEEYYDEDFEDYVPEEASKIEQAQEEKEAIGVFMSVISGKDQGISPTKRAAVERAFEKKPLILRSSDEKKEQCIKECMQIVGEERYKLLYELVSECYQGAVYKETEELRSLRTKGSKSEKMAINLIEQIKFYEQE